VGFSWPTRFMRTGLIGRKDLEALVANIEAELDANSKAATRTKIVEMTDELRLGPSPVGIDPQIWSARCPQTNHDLQLNTSIDKFFCGYCKRSGGPEELALLVAERRKRADT
jgi:hypothetical protein